MTGQPLRVERVYTGGKSPLFFAWAFLFLVLLSGSVLLVTKFFARRKEKQILRYAQDDMSFRVSHGPSAHQYG